MDGAWTVSLSDNDLGRSLIELLDRKARILEVFVIDAIGFLDKKGLLEEFVEERMERRNKNAF